MAVDWIDGPLMVVAGPGSGKTELLSVRVANILRKRDIPAGSLLCLTFTDAAALNMKKRLVEMIGEKGYKVPTFTFHSFCKEVMSSYSEYFYDGANFNLADEITKTELLEEILQDADYDDPLKSSHPELGFVYLKPLKRMIPELKKAGITPEELRESLEVNQKVIDKINPFISDTFSNRVSNSMRDEIVELIDKLRKMEVDFPLEQFKPLNEILANSLSKTLEVETTKEITAWKNEWTKRKKEGRVLRDKYYIEKHKSLVNKYEKYEEEMHKRGLYDFSDLILDVIRVLEKEESLRYELQERYQYIMVDEFQDTSGVQMRLLKNLTADEPHDKPNVCVVGDDDQAIYRFQGAEISNILNFKESYSEVNVITLKNNYRSGKEILEKAKTVISKGEERLESKLKEVDKNLVAVNKNLEEEVDAKSFKTKEEEYSYVVNRVKSLIDRGVDPQEIAVMARKHKILKEIAPYFSEAEIPIYAERKVNVLENELIRQIIEIIRFAVYLLDGDKDKADQLLPEILSYPFWDLKRKDLWRLARDAYQNGSSWFEEMERGSFQEIADFLSDLAQKSRYKTAEEIFDYAIGNKGKGSPIKRYYFNKEALKEDPTRYFKFLSALKRFTSELRGYKEGRLLKARNILEFFDRHRENGIAINDTNPLITDSKAVSLITANSSKGREFEAVFLLSCQEEIWAKGGRSSRLPLPSNIPLNIPETRDDHLRLFYVSLTRAKRFLTITAHLKKENGRGYSPLEFIDHFDMEEKAVEVGYRSLEVSRKGYHSPPFKASEKELLKPLAENYLLSSTGFNKYLNVADNGPEDFLQDTLLRFPTKKHPAASYGTAIHETINRIYEDLKNKGEIPSREFVLDTFKKFLKKERLSEDDFSEYSKRGTDSLKAFYQSKIESFNVDDLTEKSFRNQGVVIEGHRLTGKIDKIVKQGRDIEVADFKTGKPIESWNPRKAYDKIKAWKYRNQLIFYKLLIESSSEFEGSVVKKASLEFVEPNEDGKIITLPAEIKDEEVERMKKLIKIVGDRIKKLDFSTDREYRKKAIKEIEEFENYLLSKKI